MNAFQKFLAISMVAIVGASIGAATVWAVTETIDVLAWNKAGCMLNMACRDMHR